VRPGILITLILLLAAPAVAPACPVCFSAKKDSRTAYYATTALLTGAPFALAGTFLVVIRRRARRRPPGDDSQPRS
jgi:hypothetical protein